MGLNRWSVEYTGTIHYFDADDNEVAFIDINRGKCTVHTRGKNGIWRVIRTTKSLAKAAEYVEYYDLPELMTYMEFRTAWSKLFDATPQDEVPRERLYPLWRLDEAITELDSDEVMTDDDYDRLVRLYNDWWETSWSGDNGMTKLAMEFRDMIDAVA